MPSERGGGGGFCNPSARIGTLLGVLKSTECTGLQNICMLCMLPTLPMMYG